MAGITPLHFCIFRGNNEQATTIIESGECDLDAGDAGGQTPCHIACYRDNIVIVKKLLEAGADPTKADKSGNTPMHAAAGEGAMAVAKYFVEKGVPGSVKNAEGFTPLDLAERHCPPRSRAAMLKLLEQHAPARSQEDRQKDDEEARLKQEIEDMQRQLQQQQRQQQQQQQPKPLQPKPRFLQGSQPLSPGSFAGDNIQRSSSVGAVGGPNIGRVNSRGSHRNTGSNGSNGSGDAIAGVGAGRVEGPRRENQGSPMDTEAQAMAEARDSSDPLQQTLYRMLLRQHESIDSLTEVVKTQANTIAAMVPLVGAAAGARSGKSSKGRRSSSSANGVREAGRSGVAEGADVEAIAEMVAYLDDDVPPKEAGLAAAATAAVVGERTS